MKHRALEALARTSLTNKRIFMSSVTDPYQPLESKIRLTRTIVEHMAQVGARLVVQTRSPIVARDIDLLQTFKNVRINMSITTDCDAVRQRYEPNCASIERRLEAVKQLKQAGLRVHVCIAPMLPMKDPESFARRLDDLGVDGVGTVWFDYSPRQTFASNTREAAYALARADRWTKEKFQATTNRLRHASRAFASGGGSVFDSL